MAQETRQEFLQRRVQELKDWLFDNPEHPDRIQNFRLKIQYQQELNGSRELSKRFQ